MARILLILSILLGLGTAFLGFKAKQQAEDLQKNLSDTKGQLNSTRSTLEKTKKDLDETKKNLEETQTTLKQKEEELTAVKADAQKAKSDLEKAVADVEVKTRELDQLKVKLAELMGPDAGGDPKALAQQIEQMKADLGKKETELAEAVQLRETFKQRAEEAESKAQVTARQVEEYKAGFVRNGLTGRILAYNPGWNFVVLNIGDKAGLKPGVQMVVTRGGAMIGKLRVTTVEPSTAIADVLPGTIARGEDVQPGDSVVYQGSR
jgi:cell shape-determining protein MreC